MSVWVSDSHSEDDDNYNLYIAGLPCSYALSNFFHFCEFFWMKSLAYDASSRWLHMTTLTKKDEVIADDTESRW